MYFLLCVNFSSEPVCRKLKCGGFRFPGWTEGAQEAVGGGESGSFLCCLDLTHEADRRERKHKVFPKLRSSAIVVGEQTLS